MLFVKGENAAPQQNTGRALVSSARGYYLFVILSV